mgnify:FL=1
MINKNFLIGIFALALLLAFSNAAKAFDFEQVGSLVLSNVNYSIVGGTDVGSTARLDLDFGNTDGNLTIRILTNATGLNTWTAVTLASVSGNTSCYSNSTCFKSTANTAGGDSQRVTMTLPADVVHAAFRTEINGTENRTHFLTIDSTAPTFTLFPAEGFVYSATNKTVNVTVVTNENVSSIWVFMDNVNHSNTIDVQGANGLTRTGDRTWAFSYVKPSDGVLTYYARAYDYAGDGNNAATSSIRSFLLNTGPSQGAKIAAFQQAQAAQGAITTTNVLVLIGIGAAIWYFGFRRK